MKLTALGMGLFFGAIILLWWMMALLTKLMAEKEDISPEAEEIPVATSNFKMRAAAAAVALALAEQQATHAHPLSTPPTAIVSAWQLGMRMRQLSEKGTPILRKPRKVG